MTPTTPQNNLEERITAYSNWLEALLDANAELEPKGRFAEVNTRGVLAALRSGLSGDEMRMWPHVAPFLEERAHTSDRWFFVIGKLAGWHPLPRRQKTLSESFGQTAHLLNEESASKKVYFAALLACDENDLEDRLRRVVGLLRAADEPVAIDYRRLLRDLMLIGWNHPERRVQQKWARDFYRTARDNALTEAPGLSDLSSEL